MLYSAKNLSAIIDIKKKNYNEAEITLQDLYGVHSENFGKTSLAALNVLSNLLVLYYLKLDFFKCEATATELTQNFKMALKESRRSFTEQNYYYFRSKLFNIEYNILNYSLLKIESNQEYLVELFNIKQFLNRLNYFNNIDNLNDDNYENIRSILNSNQVLVSIFRVNRLDKRWEYIENITYLFFVVTRDKIQCIQVITGSELETAHFANYQTSIERKNADFNSYKVFWEFIEHLLEDRTEIIISPEGVYKLININSLRNEDGEYLIEKRNYRLLTTYDALRETDNSKTTKRAALFADPDYASAISNSEAYDNSIQQMLPRLFNTKEEIKAVKEILETKAWDVETFMQKEASVTNLKKLLSPTILHIATHGFIRDIDIGKMELEESLLYTGLYLSDSLILSDYEKKVIYNSNTVLRAYEIRGLNLNSTELVLLSACDTGKSYILLSGAAFGIQRSFLIAGAKQVISTLWKIPDEQSKELIILFYKNVVDNQDYETALRNAQLTFKAKYKHPYYWAAFVLLKNR